MKNKAKSITTTEPQDKLQFTTEQIELIRSTIAPDATPNELQLFLYQAQRTGLDPLARQIYFVKRGGRAVIQTSVDGFRVVAQRSGDYAGQDEPDFEEVNGLPKKCKVTVYKFSPTGQRYPAAVGVAYWNEYYPGKGIGFMWDKMPHTMLAKVAECLALRKAFPQDLSGLYGEEEMSQADTKKMPTDEVHTVSESVAQQITDTYEKVTAIEEPPIIEATTPIVTPPITRDQKARIMELLTSKGKTLDDLDNAVTVFKVDSYQELNTNQAEKLIIKMESLPDSKKKDSNEEEEIDIDEIDKALNNQSRTLN